MKRIALAGLSLVLAAGAAHGQTLYTVTANENFLRTVDPNTAETLSDIELTVAGDTVTGGNGLATHPFTNQLYGAVKLDSAPAAERFLVTINPGTGQATVIGNTGIPIAGMAFDCRGRLYAVSGDGGDQPETLYRIDTQNGTPTMLSELGNGDDGEALGFSPATPGLLYHASGHSGDWDPNSGDGVVFESVAIGTWSVTDIPIAGTDLVEEEAQALTWWQEENVFLWKQDHGAGPLYRVSLAGVPTLVGEQDLDHQAKGLAFVPTHSCLPFVDGFESGNTSEWSGIQL